MAVKKANKTDFNAKKYYSSRYYYFNQQFKNGQYHQTIGSNVFYLKTLKEKKIH